MRYLRNLILTAFSFGAMTTPQAVFAAPPPVSAYSQLPAAWDAALSPDGKHIALITEHDGAFAVRILEAGNISGSGSKIKGFGKDIMPLWIKWANNDQILLSLQGKQNIGNVPVHTGFLYTFDKNLEGARMLIEPGSSKKMGTGIRSNESATWQFNNVVVDFLDNDPDSIVMAFSMEHADRPAVRRVNVKTGYSDLIRKGNENIQYWISDNRGEVRVGQGKKQNSKGYYVTIRDAEGSSWKEVADYPGLKRDENILGFTEDPNEMVVARYQGADTLGLFIYDLAQKKITRKLFQHPEYDVEDILKSADGKRVVGAKYIAQKTEIEFFDGAEGRKLSAIEATMPGYQVDYIDQTADGSKAIIKVLAPNVPTTLALYDAGTRKVEHFATDYPKLQNVEPAHVQAVSYSARDGQKIPAFVTLPRKVADSGTLKDLPFIIMPHGGPQARDSESFDYIAQYLASRGYAVLQMNYRGSIGYGKTFANAGKKNWIVMQEDVEDATRWLVSKGYADKDRICMMGWSYGGYASLMGALKHPELYSCAVSIAGVTDILAMINDRKKYRFGRSAKGYFYDGFESKDDIKDNSPVKLASTLSVPLLIAHGTDDVAVHFDQFKAMKSAVKKSSAPVTALELKGSDHYILDSQNRNRLFKEIDKFLLKHLGESDDAL